MLSLVARKGTRALYFLYAAVSGLVLGFVILHAQFVVKVGSIYAVVLIPLTLVVLLSFTVSKMQVIVEKSMRTKMLRPTYGSKKGQKEKKKSQFLFGSADAEIIVKSLLFTLGFFSLLYFGIATALFWFEPLATFIISTGTGAIVVLLYTAWRSGQ